jgi:hypothetical protein
MTTYRVALNSLASTGQPREFVMVCAEFQSVCDGQLIFTTSRGTDNKEAARFARGTWFYFITVPEKIIQAAMGDRPALIGEYVDYANVSSTKLPEGFINSPATKPTKRRQR